MANKQARLNPLQLRTLALVQELADDDDMSGPAPDGEGRILYDLPHAHGDHLHVGRFTVPARFASGLNNRSVLQALARKGLVYLDGPGLLVLLPAGRDYVTGVRESLLEASDH